MASQQASSAKSSDRKRTIINSLRAGNWIYMSWSGSSQNGRLSYSLDGVQRLREDEVMALKMNGFIRPMRSGERSPMKLPYRFYQWKPYVPTDDVNDGIRARHWFIWGELKRDDSHDASCSCGADLGSWDHEVDARETYEKHIRSKKDDFNQ